MSSVPGTPTPGRPPIEHSNVQRSSSSVNDRLDHVHETAHSQAGLTGTEPSAKESVASATPSATSRPPPMYHVRCTSCGAMLRVALPHDCNAFQCCVCKAIFSVAPRAETDAESSKGVSLGSVSGKGALFSAPKKRRRADPNDPTSARQRKPRELTEYNKFLKSEIAQIKSEAPSTTQREAFTEATRRWRSRSHAGDAVTCSGVGALEQQSVEQQGEAAGHSV